MTYPHPPHCSAVCAVVGRERWEVEIYSLPRWYLRLSVTARPRPISASDVIVFG